LVEDDLPTRDLYDIALTRRGYVVGSVDDGLAALRFIEVVRPDAIVLDMELPRLGGRDVLRELRANPATRGIPVVIVTGTDVTDLNERAGVEVLQKPVDVEALVQAVDRSIRRDYTGSDGVP
jgi:DNA-binding response OmpR family regulator